ncbi:annexin B10-like isoform X1 [Macrosteles quadrilineatus]|uniref:annexin B10-like isoform X1 n=1 Tax=Macrosteles quadrilineatus TaxID=74068 RepID=UPI0023E2BC5F|nr:annexin B10-like isoform X1 [Macrosteles quadrilineatus]
MNYYRPEPTVVPFSGFNAAEDGAALRQAMKGLGTDEQAIIDILTKRSNNQRQQISKWFTEEYGRDLIKDLKSELGGKFEDVIIGLMSPPVEYLCQQLNKAMKGAGCDEMALIEILCTRSNKEIKEINETYERLYNRPLAEHVCSETKSDFRRFLTLVVTAVRNPPGHVTPEKAKEQAEALYAAGEAKLGTNEEVFNKIMAHESYEQLRLVFDEYKNVSGRTIEQAIKDELGGPLHDAMMAVIQCVQNPLTFYAKQLQNAMAGLGTNDTTLIRIIVSRCEIDLGNIKKEYERLYGKTLESVVKAEASGNYESALLGLIDGNAS